MFTVHLRACIIVVNNCQPGSINSVQYHTRTGSHRIYMVCGGVSSHPLTHRVTFVDFESGFCFALLFLLPLTYFFAIYSKCHPGFGIIIAMCNYLQRDFVPKMKIREGHLYGISTRAFAKAVQRRATRMFENTAMTSLPSCPFGKV